MSAEIEDCKGHQHQPSRMPIFGRDSKPSDSDQTDLLIDPALRESPSSPPAQSDKNESVHQPSGMPHRVEPFQMSSPFVSPALCSDARLFNVTSFVDRHRRHHFDTSSSSSSSASAVNAAAAAAVHRLPSPPPPIATMQHSHSPSPSVVSPPPAMYSTSYQHDPPMMQSVRHHSTHYNPRGEPINHGPYVYSSHPPPFDQQQQQQQQHQQQQPRYDQHQHQHQHQHHPHQHQQDGPTHSQFHASQTLFTVPTMSHPHQSNIRYTDGRQYPLPGQAPVTIVHTDDAATKLTDGIRRRCFNCCTTDTSTWRRSNLSPGKVLCNKCGLFERTHSRPRPDQFPHKRGPLTGSALRGRTPPGNQLPPISGGAPYQYHHSSITPLNTGGGGGEYHQSALPGLQTWNNTSGSSSNSSGNGNGNNVHPHMHHEGGHVNGTGGPSDSSGNASSSSNMAPLLLPSRRPTLESPRLSSSSSSVSSAAAPAQRISRAYDDALASNAVHDPHAHPHPHSLPSSQPASPPSRSATTVPGGGGGGGGGGSLNGTAGSHDGSSSAPRSPRDPTV
ncbi:hypothetical protein B0H34DRAFT_797211 [Crassisporium funariophilum]|nr:hypothetical protein B0H34DRAFT_797211 [Crassisporium funariophilum]